MGLWDSIKDGWQEIVVDTWNEVSEKVDHPKLSRGAVLRIELTRLGVIGFDHYGIYAGNKEVIHFSRGKVRKESLEYFTEDAGFFNGSWLDVMSFDPEAIKNITLEQSFYRAKSCLGMKGYDVLDSNCEHFALWCRTGVAYSGQAFGSRSNSFEFVNAASASINFPRMIGEMYNELGMKKSRHISISGIVDI